MKFFVTGGTGFIGVHFLRQAMAAGHEVVALRRVGSLPRLPLDREPTWVEGELAGPWDDVLKGCDGLVHLAAEGVNPGSSDWLRVSQANVSDSLALWLRAVNAGVKRLVVCGSCFEYGNSGARYDFIPVDAPLEPTGAYHASKAAATMMAYGLGINRNVECLILRPFQVYGEGESEARFWPGLRKAALAGEDFPMTGGEQVRDFVPVEDVAAAFVSALTRADIEAGKPLIENVGTGTPRTLRQFAEFWWEKWGATGELKFGSVPYRHQEVMRYVPKLEN